MSSLEFPRFYTPRAYQQELHAMWEMKRIGIAVYPRQSGKDMAMSMQSVKDCLATPKINIGYIAPTIPDVKEILWEKRYFDPEANSFLQVLQDNVPESEVVWRNHAMEGRFTNKSRLKLTGYFQSGRGDNGVGTSYQQYNFTELSLFVRENPIDRIMPIIVNEQEQKKLRAVATPRGKRENPLWQLMKRIEGRSDAQVLIRTIEDLNEMQRRAGLPPVVSEQALEQEREGYLIRFGNERMFEQEYYCSFEEMDAAAVYGLALTRIIESRRNESFNLSPSHPVYVVFDIGSAGKQSDATSWIAFQWYNNKLFIYDCGEGHGRALPEYVDDLQKKHWFHQLAYIILPWDGEHHEVSIVETPADMMRKRFKNVAVLSKSRNVYSVKGLPTGANADIITMVQQVRMALENTYINGRSDEQKKDPRWQDEPNAEYLLACLENYKYAFDTKAQQWSSTPVHDKWSHLADTLRYAVQATKELDVFGGDLYDPYRQALTDTYQTSDYNKAWKDEW